MSKHTKHRNGKARDYAGAAIGMSKHRKSGKSSKSPRLRHLMSLEAQRGEVKAPKPLPYTTVDELFRS